MLSKDGSEDGTMQNKAQVRLKLKDAKITLVMSFILQILLGVSKHKSADY